MVRNFNFKIVLFLSFVIVAFSCAKERTPTLNITVVDEQGVPAPGAIVHAWPSDDASATGSTVNEIEMDKTGSTDALGQISFDFKFSAVLDVDVKYYKTTQVSDGMGGLTTQTDSLSGHKVVKIETVRQRSKDNDYNELVEVK
ncbi:hypothetical protein FRY74_11205 [Vicingus serpentipes]|uniref:Carboxypeptidase regulatory-like domain-containing protein n=1 Tax=Vicingus serpentipes TaxID=1926625 RepID=A0A5C6RPR7_9FLAO|nr:hypothetical protein [Vicingus serpentipes]TXB64351.1 hypothetical protein FRY74_11205 [Vicingus serpentipes]